jgi:hypothetical protein
VTVAIEGLELHLSTGFWRSDYGMHCYSVRTSIAEFRRRRGSAALLPLHGRCGLAGFQVFELTAAADAARFGRHESAEKEAATPARARRGHVIR